MAAGVYHGAPVDLRDGFIHFSTARQARETAAKHFAGREGLIIAAIDVDGVGDSLKWEVSRNNDLFPHLYAPLDTSAVIATYELPLDAHGLHIFPEVIH